MSDLNGTEANQTGLSANTEADHSTTHQPVTTKDMATDIEKSNGHSLQDKTEAEALPSESKENGSLEVGDKPTEATIEDKMDTTEDAKDSEPAKQPTAEASTGDKRVRDEDDVEHKPTDTVQETSETAAAPVAAADVPVATTDASADEIITKELKKQKTDADATATTITATDETAPSADTTAPAATTSTTETTTEESTPKKKAGRPKKDDTKVPSVTDEVKEAVETVSRRTRSKGSA